ncbi:MAG: hypothetical protein HY744_19815 [Deltaproteobacteria bacterium]|nr:hypothetical protein [Deltaproteobacteria bacterium]
MPACAQIFGIEEATVWGPDAGAGGGGGGGGAGPECTTPDTCPKGTTCHLATCAAGKCGFEAAGEGTSCAEDGGKVCDGKGECVACNVPSDCQELPADNDCRKRACVEHACKEQFEKDGKSISVQTEHDCQKEVCDGQGGTKLVPDDTDLPEDNNDCTKDQCVGGSPESTDLPEGTPCGQNNAFQCLGGKCGCTSPSDCLGEDGFCGARTCVNSLCGWSYTEQGTLLPDKDQIPGDCQVKVCDGKGKVQSIADDTDKHDDGLECTEDLCASGSVQHPGKPLDTECAIKTKYCDGKGACVACNSPPQCPAGKPCESATCSANKCGLEPTPEGALAPPGQQVAKDCKKAVCDGQAGTKLVPDPSDLPDDGQQCTKDECSGSTPSFPPKDLDTACNENGGKYCNGLGACAAPPASSSTRPPWPAPAPPPRASPSSSHRSTAPTSSSSWARRAPRLAALSSSSSASTPTSVAPGPSTRRCSGTGCAVPSTCSWWRLTRPWRPGAPGPSTWVACCSGPSSPARRSSRSSPAPRPRAPVRS